jgi:hypothetical protein
MRSKQNDTLVAEHSRVQWGLSVSSQHDVL